MHSPRSAVVALLATLAVCACSESPNKPAAETGAGLRFVPASPQLRAKCRATARAVGYPVPCPTHVLAGLGATGSAVPVGCLDVIGPSGVGGCAKSWRGWVFGSSNPGDQHLVITASPRRLTNYAKVVNGPAWYPQARVRPLGWVNIKVPRVP